MRSVVGKLEARITRGVAARLHRLWFDAARSPLPFPVRQVFNAASGLYRIGLERDRERARTAGTRLPAYVISIGNLTVGGTGKTPMTLWLAERLARQGIRCAVLSRGYGRQGDRPGPVQPDGDLYSQAAEFGDEPVLLAHRLGKVPVYVGRHRSESGLAAIRERGATVLILDDGFQHIVLHRDLDFVLLDSKSPFGNGQLLPAGPLREPASSLDRADVVILTRAEDPAATRRTIKNLHPFIGNKPLFRCRHTAKGFRSGLTGPFLPMDSLRDRRAVLFSGIANPADFFAWIEKLGIIVERRFGFPDHHRFDHEDVSIFLTAVRESRADWLITTEKDAVRLPPAFRNVVITPEIDIDFGPQEKSFLDFLAGRLPTSSYPLPPLPGNA